ncbi:hypothetical protein [Bradyrhizobium jicamae]|uniref:hypothetical protein n=1 Tax=Bradyrhizobium jicamae TaxID=280332 RepID=UPI000AB312CF|nr:hypothetical protein [Bradyrhizobium jicamae]
MSNTNPNWFSWLSFPFFAPLSGSATQDIAPNFLKISDTEKEMLQAVGLSDRGPSRCHHRTMLAALVRADWQLRDSSSS